MLLRYADDADIRHDAAIIISSIAAIRLFFALTLFRAIILPPMMLIADMRARVTCIHCFAIFIIFASFSCYHFAFRYYLRVFPAARLSPLPLPLYFRHAFDYCFIRRRIDAFCSPMLLPLRSC